MITLSAHPPMARRLRAEWQRTGQPPDPAAWLIPDWITAVTGTRRRVRRLCHRATREDFGWLDDSPGEVDRAPVRRPELGRCHSSRAARYAIICTLMLAAQETAYRCPDEAGREPYCAGCAASAGYASGIHQPPHDHAGLRAAYETILDRQLQGTSSGRAALTAMLTGQIAGEPAAGLARDAVLLVDDRTARCLGLDEAFQPGRTEGPPSHTTSGPGGLAPPGPHPAHPEPPRSCRRGIILSGVRRGAGG